MGQKVESEMSLTARIYIAVVISLGTLALGAGLYHWEALNTSRFLWYLALAIPASCLKVRLPGIKVGTMSVLFMFLLGAIVELNLPQTLVIGAVCVIAQSRLWHSKSLVHVSSRSRSAWPPSRWRSRPRSSHLSICCRFCRFRFA